MNLTMRHSILAAERVVAHGAALIQSLPCRLHTLLDFLNGLRSS
jgi:hypothetical protein